MTLEDLKKEIETKFENQIAGLNQQIAEEIRALKKAQVKS